MSLVAGPTSSWFWCFLHVLKDVTSQFLALAATPALTACLSAMMNSTAPGTVR